MPVPPPRSGGALREPREDSCPIEVWKRGCCCCEKCYDFVGYLDQGVALIPGRKNLQASTERLILDLVLVQFGPLWQVQD